MRLRDAWNKFISLDIIMLVSILNNIKIMNFLSLVVRKGIVIHKLGYFGNITVTLRPFFRH